MQPLKKICIYFLIGGIATTAWPENESQASLLTRYFTHAVEFTLGFGALGTAVWRAWPSFVLKHNPAPDICPAAEQNNGTVFIFAHGFGDDKNVVQALNKFCTTDAIIGFNFMDCAVGKNIPWSAYRFTNLGQELDTLTLLIEIVRAYLSEKLDLEGKIIFNGIDLQENSTKPLNQILWTPINGQNPITSSRKIGIAGHSRGGAATIGALEALTFPEEHKKIWDNIQKEFNIPTALMNPLIVNVRTAVEAAPIFLVQPLLNTKKIPFFTQFGSLQSVAELFVAIISNYNPFAEQPIAKLQKIARQNVAHFNITITLAIDDEVVGTTEYPALNAIATSSHQGISPLTIIGHHGGHNDLSVFASKIKAFLEQQQPLASPNKIPVTAGRLAT